jgi:hypothetical protein
MARGAKTHVPGEAAIARSPHWKVRSVQASRPMYHPALPLLLIELATAPSVLALLAPVIFVRSPEPFEWLAVILEQCWGGRRGGVRLRADRHGRRASGGADRL